MSRIFTVRELTGAVKEVVEAQFPFVWVRGQVSNLARPGSGHIYFTLKDQDAVLNVVWFRGNQWLGGEGCVNPLTGEVCEGGPLELGNDMEVLCAGRLTVYPPRGAYQLAAELVQEMGQGLQAQAFEALKRKLAAKGYFEQDRKQILPRHVARVAVVTAPTGAAVRDFMRIAAERGCGASIRIHPVRVQGTEAAREIAGALDTIDAQGWAEVAVLIRGGGSVEDLWAFNTEEVADAVFRSRIPVVSGVGHEVDVTIADLTADVRAATPSHAAQLIWPARTEYVQRVDDLELRLLAAVDFRMNRLAERLAGQERALAWLSPAHRLDRLAERHDNLSARLARAGKGLFDGPARVLETATGRLARAGMAFTEQADRRVRDRRDRLARLYGPQAFAAREARLTGLARRLELAVEALLGRAEHRIAEAGLKLAGLDPLRPLERGYSLVTVERTGAFLRGPADVAAGDRLVIRARDGEVPAVAGNTQGPGEES